MKQLLQQGFSLIVTLMVMTGIMLIVAGYARAENNVAPALSLRQQTTDVPAASATAGMIATPSRLVAEASQTAAGTKADSK